MSKVVTKLLECYSVLITVLLAMAVMFVMKLPSQPSVTPKSGFTMGRP